MSIVQSAVVGTLLLFGLGTAFSLGATPLGKAGPKIVRAKHRSRSAGGGVRSSRSVGVGAFTFGK